jgi:hypothetical protein
MDTIIDLGAELLVDRSSIQDPFLRLIVAALGKTLLDGSAWVAVNKQDLGRAYCSEIPKRRLPGPAKHQ